MDATMEGESINVGEQRIQEVIAQRGLLFLVKSKAHCQVRNGGREDFNSHRSGLRRSFLAASQSTYASLPSSKRCSRSRRTFPCQTGDSNRSAFRLRSCHSASI